MTRKMTATGLDPTTANTQPFSQTDQFDQIGKLQRKTLLLLWHFLILSLLNAWYNCTSGTQKSFWNYVKKMTNCLQTLGKDNKNFFYRRKITHGLCFWTFQSVMEFRSFLKKKKNRGVPQIPRKSSYWVVGARTKEGKRSIL